MTKRKQKNLRLDEEYHDKLENLAEEWFNSKKKQGQVVEKLLDMHGDNDIVGMISDIHNEVVTDNSQIDTHTEENDSISTAEEIETKAENGEFIDLNKYDLSEVKGSRSVDKALIFNTIAQQQMDTVGFDKSDIRELIVSEANYGYNGANEIAGSILTRYAIELPDIDEKFSDTVPSYDDIQEFIDDRINVSDYAWSDDTAQNIVEHNISILDDSASASKGKTSKRLIGWYKKQVDYDFNIDNSSDENDSSEKSSLQKIADKKGIKTAVITGTPHGSTKLTKLVEDLYDDLDADFGDIDDIVRDEYDVIKKGGIEYINKGD